MGGGVVAKRSKPHNQRIPAKMKASAKEPIAVKRESVVRPTFAYRMPPVIAAALVQAQKGLKALARSSENEAFGSAFTPLPDVMTVAIQLLNGHGVAVSQAPMTDSAGHSALETMFVHESGVGYSTITKLALKEVTPQAHASAITYMRRYALMSMLGLTSLADDDDGNRAAGVLIKPTEEQIERIKSQLTNLRYPVKQIAAEVFKLKTKDHADLAIINYEKIISMRVRDHESKEAATKIEVASDLTDDLEEGSPQATLQARLKALNLASKSVENRVVMAATGRPFMSKVTEPDHFRGLDAALNAIESGVRLLPADWYAPTTEPTLVDEPVA